MIFQILAVSRNGVIGCEGEMPWRLPADLAYFKKITLGHPVIMGRKTWESIGRPLKGRKNIIVTRNQDQIKAGIGDENTPVILCETLEQAVIAAGTEDAFIIGGGDIYRQSTDICDGIYLTYIDEDFEGDTFYDMEKLLDFHMISNEKGIRDEKNPHCYYFRQYRRQI